MISVKNFWIFRTLFAFLELQWHFAYFYYKLIGDFMNLKKMTMLCKQCVLYIFIIFKQLLCLLEYYKHILQTLRSQYFVFVVIENIGWKQNSDNILLFSTK